MRRLNRNLLFIICSMGFNVAGCAAGEWDRPGALSDSETDDGSKADDTSGAPGSSPARSDDTRTLTAVTGSELNDITDSWAEGFIRNLADRELLVGFPDKTFRPHACSIKSQPPDIA